MKAYLGFIAGALFVIVPLFAVLIVGARSGKGRKKTNYSWTKGFKVSPPEWVNSFTKTRPK